MFVAYVMVAAVLGAASALEASPVNAEVPVAAAAAAPAATSGWSGLLGCVWEEDSVGCLREHSSRALKEIHAAKKEAQAAASAASATGTEKDESILEVLHDGTARMIEYLSKEDEQEATEENKTEGDAEGQNQGRLIEEGRKKIKIPKFGKKGKKGGGLLQTFYMLKMMFGMMIQMKMAVLSFLLQVKTFFLSLIFVTIVIIQFFWKLQEKKAHGGISYGPPSGGWDAGSSFGGYGASAQGGSGGGWDKRAWSEHAHRQAYAAQAPAS